MSFYTDFDLFRRTCRDDPDQSQLFDRFAEFAMQFPSSSSERHVLRGVLRGYSDETLSTTIQLSLSTVRQHRQRVFRSLRSAVGDDFFAVALRDPAECLSRLERSVNPDELVFALSPYFLQELEARAEDSVLDFALRPEHREFLQELSRHSCRHIQQTLDKADPHLLGYLRALLRGETHSPDDLKGLASLLLPRDE